MPRGPVPEGIRSRCSRDGQHRLQPIGAPVFRASPTANVLQPRAAWQGWSSLLPRPKWRLRFSHRQGQAKCMRSILPNLPQPRGIEDPNMRGATPSNDHRQLGGLDTPPSNYHRQLGGLDPPPGCLSTARGPPQQTQDTQDRQFVRPRTRAWAIPGLLQWPPAWRSRRKSSASQAAPLRPTRGYSPNHCWRVVSRGARKLFQVFVVSR